MKKLLLIGAGFSYDLGMPLANGFTKDFFHYFTPEKLKYFMDNWKLSNPYGDDSPISPDKIDEVYELFLKYREGESGNYEEFLKKIQLMHNDSRADYIKSSTLHFVFGKFFSMIIQMFWMYQVNNLEIYETNKKYYNEFSRFLSNDEETWIVSLNHDVNIELLSLDLKIPLSYGFKESIHLPKSNLELDNTLSFQTIKRSDLILNNMDFIYGRRGINLLKLHGGLNEYSYNNDKELLTIPFNNKDNTYTYLSKVNRVLHEMCYYIKNHKAKIESEIAISDLNGEMQFLRYSILTGGKKYSETFDPKPGEEKLQLMKEFLDVADEINIIGYGFCDLHVNLKLYNAMYDNDSLTINIVDPYIKDIPELLKPFNYNSRIKLYKMSAAEFFTCKVTNSWDNTLINDLNKSRDNRIKHDELYRLKFLSSKK